MKKPLPSTIIKTARQNQMAAAKVLRKHIKIDARLRYLGLSPKGAHLFEHTWCSLQYGIYYVTNAGVIWEVTQNEGKRKFKNQLPFEIINNTKN